MKLSLQQTKNQVNRRFLQAVMAELPLWNFLDSKQEWKQNGHSSLIWAPIKMNEYPLER
jgi:hypothetical protein